MYKLAAALALELVLHPESRAGAVRRVTASAQRVGGGMLEFAYSLEADLERLRVPPTEPVRPGRELWRHTCCEAFVAAAGAPAYREWNFSPSGEWAAYAFRGYREAGETFAAAPPYLEVRRSESGLALRGRVAEPVEGRLAIGLSAVIEAADGSLSYWALRHVPGRPDFHRREAFVLELE